LSREIQLDGATVERLYEIYRDAFDDLRIQAVARQVLTAEEFAGEMADPRIEKYVAWDEQDSPVGVCTLATDPDAVPWISSDYLRAAYPDHAARSAVFYLGIACVEQGREHRGAYHSMLAALFDRVGEARGVCGFDTCTVTERLGVSRSAAAMCRVAGVDITPIDRQTYFVADFGNTDISRFSAPEGT
jgi:hypothetical protein